MHPARRAISSRHDHHTNTNRPSPASSPPPKPPAPTQSTPPSPPPPQVNRSQLLAHLYDPDFHTLRLCDLHKLSVADLADELHAEQIIHAIEAAQRIVELRLSLIRAEAELAAWARLHDLAANFPTTPRDRETARKAASHILRERRADKPNPPTSRDRQGAEARPPQNPTSTQPTQRAPSVRDGVIQEPTSRDRQGAEARPQKDPATTPTTPLFQTINPATPNNPTTQDPAPQAPAPHAIPCVRSFPVAAGSPPTPTSREITQEPTPTSRDRQGAEARPPKDSAPTPTTPPSQTTNLNLPNHPINHKQAPTPHTIPCVRSFPVAAGSTPPPSASSA